MNSNGINVNLQPLFYILYGRFSNINGRFNKTLSRWSNVCLTPYIYMYLQIQNSFETLRKEYERNVTK